MVGKSMMACVLEVFELVAWAIEKRGHVHLVHHTREVGAQGNEVPGIEDIIGL
ncbi:hypothetical protein [Telmatospirillum siberiense]|uniref:hypothetical protein n=1 Tax=Telmatospirillum siberiense TaxID=382514 RepID=UPI0013044184|nr:hypothetical protein [Telmatospirillum siberiense]